MVISGDGDVLLILGPKTSHIKRNDYGVSILRKASLNPLGGRGRTPLANAAAISKGMYQKPTLLFGHFRPTPYGLKKGRDGDVLLISGPKTSHIKKMVMEFQDLE